MSALTLESLDRRATKLEEDNVAMVGSTSEIIHRLNAQSGLISQVMLRQMAQGKQLDEHTVILERHEQLLQAHGRRLDSIDNRLDRMDGRLDRMDDRLNGIDNRLDRIDGRLDGIDGTLHKILERLPA